MLKGIVVGAALAVVGAVGWRSPRLRRFASREPLRLDADTPSGILDPAEMATIVALAEALIPADETPGAEASWVRSHVDERTRGTRGYLQEYRRGAALLDRFARESRPSLRSFAELPAGERDALLHARFDGLGPWYRLRILLDGPAAASEGVLAARCRRFVLEDLLVGFYQSAAGWAVVGYTHYRGVPGDPREYTVAVPSIGSRRG